MIEKPRVRDDKRRRICVSIGNNDLAAAVETARRVAPLADVIEIRLDCIAAPSLPVFFSSLRCPLLFTNRPEWEGGRFSGAEEMRVALLVEAIQAGAAFVDLELRAPDRSLALIRDAVQGAETRLILSFHDFAGTPPASELVARVREMRDRGAEIGKIVTTAHDSRDVLRVLQLQESCADLNMPLIAFCMGRAGVISRLATLELGGYMTYCAVDSREVTASGQIAVADLRTIHALLQID